MTIQTYDTLIAAITNYSYDDSTDLSAQAPSILQMAETMLQRDIDAQQLNLESSNFFVNGQEQYVFPADLVYVNFITVTYASGRRVSLQMKQPDYLRTVYWPDPSLTTGEPEYWGWVGQFDWIVSGVPNAALAYTVNYKAKLAPLAPANQTNALTEYFNDALFAACMIGAANYKTDDQLLTMWQQRYAGAVNSINIEYGATLQDENTPSRFKLVDTQTRAPGAA